MRTLRATPGKPVADAVIAISEFTFWPIIDVVQRGRVLAWRTETDENSSRTR